MSFNISAAVAAAAKQGVDMNKAQTGGGGAYEPPAEGVARARFIGYIEGGKQKHEYEGKVSYKDKIKLIFELSGPKHKPKVTDDGTVLPHRLTIEENLSLNEKAHFYKIFRAMNYEGDATHIAQLLGREFLITIKHHKSRDGKVSSFKLAKDSAGQYTIRSPWHEDPNTGETTKIAADPQVSETRLFLKDFPSIEMWNSLYIEGEYPERKNDKGEVIAPARSKNVFQDWIRGSKDWEGSEMEQLLQGGIDLPEKTAEPEPADDEPPFETGDEDDPLSGIS